MANKVISIKMDEKDIERLKKYHEVLKQIGIISDKTLSMNGLYKHLLLDYIEEDARRMISSCAVKGLLPRYLTQEQIDNEEIEITNTYNLDQETFSIYKECIREFMAKSLDDLEKNMDMLNDVAEDEIVYFEKGNCDIIPLPKEQTDERYDDGDMFWYGKAVETSERSEKEIYARSEIYDYEMINNSSISDEKKKKLISAIDDYEKNKINNIHLLGGRISSGQGLKRK